MKSKIYFLKEDLAVSAVSAVSEERLRAGKKSSQSGEHLNERERESEKKRE